ncbi:hypothetical protein DRQ26_07125 [bacterium]|nr:MAG: hypothetical protein DRQ26_07125 [bacterium]
MKIFKDLYYSNILLFVVALSLFSYGYYTNTINQVILHMLEFTVIFELVRTFNHYLKDGQFKVRYGIDAAIFYSIKELYIGFAEFKIDSHYGLLMWSLIALSILMIVRYFNSKLIEERAHICNVPGSCEANGH